jgi:6-phosphogluconolactonase (cycloisomerase 2 family)
MKFRKFGKALLMTALAAGMVFGITSCKQSYTVGYLYVTGTQTASSTGEGVISGFKIDHNTGNLKNVVGLPVSSGGANPVRAVLLTGGRFIYVLNAGSTKDGQPCSPTDVCSNANITQFSIGGNGVLAPQGTYFTQGLNPFRMVADSSGAHLFVLDHDAPDGTGCALVFGAQTTTCGDITAFSIDPTTGRLSYLLNSQVTSASGSPLPYFPVPANPIDFVISGNFFLTLSGTPAIGDSVFPYAYNAAAGQLTINQSNSQPLGAGCGTGAPSGVCNGTAIVVAGSQTYVLDDGPNTNNPPTNGQIFAFSVGAGGALQALTSGSIADSPSYSKPVWAITATGSGKSWLYILNEGDNADTTNAQSGIAAFVITNPFQAAPISGQTGSTGGTGPGPRCVLEDPSNQYVYTANYNGSSVTGLSIDQNDGNLTPLSHATKAKDTYALPGPGTWCIATGRTS